jgi:hypothetical protein
MVTVPAAIPVTMPVVRPTVAIDVADELQVPPEAASVKVVVEPTQTVFVPPMEGAPVVTVTEWKA